MMILDKLRYLGRRTCRAATITIAGEPGRLAATVWIWIDSDRQPCIFLATETLVHGRRLAGLDPLAELVDFLDVHGFGPAGPDEFARVLAAVRNGAVACLPLPWALTRVRVRGLVVCQDLADDQLALRDVVGGLGPPIKSAVRLHCIRTQPSNDLFCPLEFRRSRGDISQGRRAGRHRRARLQGSRRRAGLINKLMMFDDPAPEPRR